MIKLFRVKSFSYTPFVNIIDIEYLEEKGVFITENIKEADILIAQNFKHLKRYIWRYRKTKSYLVWTLEPRFNTSFYSVQKILLGFHKCYFMNIYTQDVFTSILAYHARIIHKDLNLIEDNFKIYKGKIVALMSYYGGIDAPPFLRDGLNIDPIALRSSLALEGNKRGVLDIYGKGWPNHLSIEDSRIGNWSGRKGEILENYAFNLCFENTVAPNYVTEKIWDSIGNYCLPIYFGRGTNIYNVFPPNSFIDYSDFDDQASLFDFVENISNTEYISRLNKCIKIYNSIKKKGRKFEWEEKKKSLDKIVDKCFLIKNA